MLRHASRRSLPAVLAAASLVGGLRPASAQTLEALQPTNEVPATPLPVDLRAPPPGASASATPAPAEYMYTARDPQVQRRPLRRGFTLELGLGGSLTFVGGAARSGYGAGNLGFTPISISVGAFVNRNVALMGRTTGTAFFETRGGKTYVATSSFFGVATQIYLVDSFFVGAGVGVARLATSEAPAILFQPHGEAGFGFEARAGYAFATAKHHVFALTFEVIPTFYGTSPVVSGGTLTTVSGGTSIVGTSLGLEWQYF
ncbi:MAG: hypothetical protein U0169_24255 [Polyangiaceae bacterium]